QAVIRTRDSDGQAGERNAEISCGESNPARFVVAHYAYHNHTGQLAPVGCGRVQLNGIASIGQSAGSEGSNRARSGGVAVNHMHVARVGGWPVFERAGSKRDAAG